MTVLTQQIRNDAARLFEAEQLRTGLRSFGVEVPMGLRHEIGRLRNSIRWEFMCLAQKYHDEHDDYGPYACAHCGGDPASDEPPCEHCGRDGFMTVDDVVEWAWRAR